MQFILDSIDQAAGSGHNFPAVVTALTVPDIAGAVDFPGDGSMKRYVSWVNQWFSPKFPTYGQHGVDGVALYALRCKLLHEGRSDPSKAPASGKSKAASGKRLIAFNVGPGIFVHLCTVTDGTGASWTALRADAFCSDVTAAARRWLVAREGDTRAMSVLASLVDVRMDVAASLAGCAAHMRCGVSLGALGPASSLPNKRFEQTNHGHDSKLSPKRGGAVVCSSTATR